MNMQSKQIINILTEIDFHIMEKTITIEELKSLILIMYKELLADNEPNLFTKDYLALVTKHFIELENNMQLTATQTYDEETQKVESFLTHKKISLLNEE